MRPVTFSCAASLPLAPEEIANQILDRGADYLLVLNTARRSWR